MYKIAFLSCLMVGCLMGFSQPAEIVVDQRDGQSYKVISIGSQTWMAENLNFLIGYSWCYNDSLSNCDIYGRLYTWEAAKSACPVNWHLPSDEEWKILEQHLGMSVEETNIFLYRGEGMGTKLKSEVGWEVAKTENQDVNKSGFSALPGGNRLSKDDSFVGIGKIGSWWTSTPDDMYPGKFAFRRRLNFDKSGIDRDAATLTLGFSVRCVKD